MRKGIVMALIFVLVLGVFAPPVGAAAPSRARGTFTVQQFNLSSPPVSLDTQCLLEGNLELAVTGTLDGTAAGPIWILVEAACQEVAANPPGTFADRLVADLMFTGTMAGRSGTAKLTYLGQTQAGGMVNGVMGVAGKPMS